MKRTLVLLLSLALLLPLGSTIWMGWQAMERDRDNLERRVRENLLLRLDTIEPGLHRGLDLLDQELANALPATVEGLDFHELGRSLPLATAAWLTRDGSIREPSPSARSLDEVRRAQVLQDHLDRGSLGRVPVEREGEDSLAVQGSASTMTPAPKGGRWTFPAGRTSPWYWSMERDGGLVVIELNRSAVFARLLGALPSRLEGMERPDLHRLVLLDEDQRVIAAFGHLEAKDDDVAMARRPLAPPFVQWNWAWYLAPEERSALGNLGYDFLLYPTLILSLVLGILFWYLRREIGRELRDARDKVSFVNQVSHELKTPLTNLQLYADLARSRVGNADQVLGDWLDVMASETRRLGRMIHNVLAFSRRDRKDPPRMGDLDLAALCERVAAGFGPSFKARGLVLELEGPAEAPHEVRTDADWVEQILANLLANGEKYASEGGLLRLEWNYGEKGISILVRDRGPGIAPRDRERIFRPFVRLSDKVTEGVSGAGLGLAIARDLARRLGGDLTVCDNGADGRGSCFVLGLPWERKTP